jgi:hypothetical protein
MRRFFMQDNPDLVQDEGRQEGGIPMRIIDGWKPVYISVGAVVLIIVVLALPGYYVVKPMTKDSGILQIATSVLLCLSVALVLLRVITKKQPVLKWVEAFYMLSVYAMREMDFHRLFTAEHVTRLKFYMGPYPLGEKLIGGTIMLLFIAITLHFLIANVSILMHDLKKKVPRAWYFIVWGFLLAGAQVIDKPHFFTGVIKPLIEETMELGAALMMVFIVLSFLSKGGQTAGRKKQ